MNIDNTTFPILDCIENNILTNNILTYLEDSGYSEDEISVIKRSLSLFINESLKIDYISKQLHKTLFDTPEYLKAKIMLQNSDEVTGLLLLPETTYPDFTNVPSYVDVNSLEYPINAILYIWLNYDNFDKRRGTFEYSWEEDEQRELLIIPIYYNEITQATKEFEMISNSEEYSEQEGRCWYGKIHDYVMSFIIYQEISLNNNKGQKQTIETNEVNFII